MTTAINAIKEKVEPILRESGVIRASVFGSFARGEQTPESDVDLLVEFQKERIPGLIGFVGLQRRLEETLGKKVDLLTYNSIYHLLRDRIMREQITFYDERS